MLTLEQGEAIVKFARAVIEAEFSGIRPDVPEILKEVFKENRGVFVTLEHYPNKELRGCIGYPEPIMPLGNAIRDSAKSAAFRDPRFHPVSENELKNLIVEVSILTEPELIKVKNPRDYPKEVKIGRDGLIVEKGWYKGLLLPQVPVEWKWNTEEFLCQTCVKAGLSPDTWLVPRIKIYKFSAHIFTEKEPDGEVEEKKIS